MMESDLSDADEKMSLLDMENDQDGNTCTATELQNVFSHHFQVAAQNAVSMKRTYILHMHMNNGSVPLVAAGLSNFTVHIYNLEYLTKIKSLQGHTGTITGVKFSPKHEQILYSSSEDGTVKLWDLRENHVNPVKEFKDSYEGMKDQKALTSFDVNCADRFICAGTEEMKEGAFLLFWDVRSTRLLGGYWETHTDDITDVSFNPSQADTMASASIDGLINVFNISKSNEDDAFQYCLNTESSVEKLRWFSKDHHMNYLSCVTQTEELQLWNINDSAPMFYFKRKDITDAMRRKASEECYVVDCYQKSPDSDGLLILAGSSAKSDCCLRLLSWKKNKLKPYADLSDKTSRVLTVRCSFFDSANTVLVTGGEDGIIRVWKSGLEGQEEKVNSELKVMPTITKSHKAKPY